MTKAVIFDFDGVVVDSEPLHMRTFQETLEPLGVKIEPSRWYKEFAGTGSGRIIQKLFDDFNVNENAQKYVEIRKKLYASYVKKGMLELKPGIREFLGKLEEKKVKIAIASGGHNSNICLVLSKFDLSDFFKIVVGSEDSKRRKPYPDPFLIAAERLGVKPEDCIVIEDSIPGAKAAKSAGMELVVMKSPACKDLNSDVLIINSFSEFPFELLG